MEREKGVISAPCYACGKALPTVERPDGSCAAIACDCGGGPAAPPPPPENESGENENPDADNEEES